MTSLASQYTEFAHPQARVISRVLDNRPGGRRNLRGETRNLRLIGREGEARRNCAPPPRSGEEAARQCPRRGTSGEIQHEETAHPADVRTCRPRRRSSTRAPSSVARPWRPPKWWSTTTRRSRKPPDRGRPIEFFRKTIVERERTSIHPAWTTDERTRASIDVDETPDRSTEPSFDPARTTIHLGDTQFDCTRTSDHTTDTSFDLGWMTDHRGGTTEIAEVRSIHRDERMAQNGRAAANRGRTTST